MRKRINKRIDIQEVVNQIEYRIGVYTTCIKDIMQKENVTYKQAKFIMNLRLNNYERVL